MNTDSKLSVEQKILVEQRITNDGKSILLAYVLWFLFAWLGGHRFYLNRPRSAIIILLLTVTGWLTAAIFIGLLPLLIVLIWVIADLFLIPRMVRSDNEELRRKMIGEMASFPDNTMRTAEA